MFRAPEITLPAGIGITEVIAQMLGLIVVSIEIMQYVFLILKF